MGKVYQIFEFDEQKGNINNFISLPKRLYKQSEKWITPSKSDLEKFLNRSHPFNTFLDHKNFLIECSGRIIGRATAFINKLLIINDKPLGSIGFFECENDIKAASMLIDKACNWLKMQNISTVWAPMNGTLWYSYRFMTQGFEDVPFFKEPYNKSYYPLLFEQIGFKPLKKWYSGTFSEDSINELINRIGKINHRLLKKGYQFRKLDINNYDNELLLLNELINDSYSDFIGYHKLDSRIFIELFKNLKQVLIPDFAYLAINPAGRTVGFNISIPNYHWMVNMPDSNTSILRYLKINQKLLSIVNIYVGITHDEIKKNNGLGTAMAYSGLLKVSKLNIPLIIALIAEDALSFGYLKYAKKNLHEYCLYYKDINNH